MTMPSEITIRDTYNEFSENKRLSHRYIIIVHDDADIDIGKIKEDENRGSAGHNGIKSIIDLLGTKNFKRLRMGINNSFDSPLEDIVLKKFSKEEEILVSEAINEACSILEKK